MRAWRQEQDLQWGTSDGERREWASDLGPSENQAKISTEKVADKAEVILCLVKFT